jgi:hypothetical protein
MTTLEQAVLSPQQFIGDEHRHEIAPAVPRQTSRRPGASIRTIDPTRRGALRYR